MRSPIFTFAVIADTHTRARERDESSPWAVNALANARARYVVARVNQLNPQFTIHLGDIVHPVPSLPTFEGAAEAAKAILAGLNAPYYCIPGNHDVGDKPFPANPAGRVSADAVASYDRHFGAPYASFSHAGCRFVLVNSPVLNSGLEAERSQRDWLEAELSRADGERIFLFTHYPPYVCHPNEPSNYDNIDAPARGWLLDLVEAHRVEALFAGHVHNFFYHRHGVTDCYLLPATSFFRQDYAELFRVEAADEHGRNDTGKLGFFTVEVHDAGHIARSWRTGGACLEEGETLKDTGVSPRELAREVVHPRERARAPLGVHLRHPWAELTELPYNGPMDEFQRKQARNDHTLLALWELGVRKLRVPIGDLLDDRIRARMAALVEMGHQLTVFCFRIPDAVTLDAMMEHAALVDAFEFVIPWHEACEILEPLARLRQSSGRPVLLSKMETSADRKAEGSRFSHFVSYGFRPEETPLVEAFLALEGARQAVDGLVFRVGLDRALWWDVARLDALVTRLAVRGVVNVRLASDNPAELVDDDSRIAFRVAEALCAAHCARSLDLFLDTFVDLDRGYFPRHGLFDRRFNPRPASFVYRHLQAILARLEPAPTAIGWDAPAPDPSRRGRIEFSAGEQRYRLLGSLALAREGAPHGSVCAALVEGMQDRLQGSQLAGAANEPVLVREDVARASASSVRAGGS